LDLAAVHCQEQAGGPVEEGEVNGFAGCADDFACQAAEIGSCFGWGQGGGNFFEEDGETLGGFVAEWSLVSGELEGVGCVVC
jgi:hypothetical protein